MAKNQNPIIVGLDIGTTKIALIAGQKNEFGKLEIVGFGKAKSTGVLHGMVLNIEQTVKAIQAAMDDCVANFPDLNLSNVYVGIAGHHIKSLQTRGDIVRQDAEEEITQKDIDLLVKDQFKTYIPAGDSIIDVIPQEFTVDNFQNIPDPIGYNGIKIGANFHIITGDKNAIRNINRSVEKASLKTSDLVLQPLASAAAVMSEHDLEAGVAIVDIGGGTTDLAVFYEGILKHTAVIPFGGENITQDIKIGCGVLKGQAEQMKIQFGYAIADEANPNAVITIPSIRGLPSKEISLQNLAHIVHARISEILDFVSYHIKQIGFDNRLLNGGIILTGGGSQLKHIIQLTEYITGLNARVGYPTENLAAGYPEELNKPMYSTCIGLIIKGFNNLEQNKLDDANFIKIETEEFAPINNTIETEIITDSIPKIQEPLKNNLNEKSRGKLSKFYSSFKSGIINLFEEEDEKI